MIQKNKEEERRERGRMVRERMLVEVGQKNGEEMENMDEVKVERKQGPIHDTTVANG